MKSGRVDIMRQRNIVIGTVGIAILLVILVALIATFVLTPLTYLGGVFYSISLLPDFWQNVSKANPILYMVNAFRYGILGTSDISIGYAYAILLIFVVLLFSACMYLMQRGIGIRE